VAWVLSNATWEMCNIQAAAAASCSLSGLLYLFCHEQRLRLRRAVLCRTSSAVLCCAVLCCAVLCCAVLCCAVLCCAVLCCAVRRGGFIDKNANKYNPNIVRLGSEEALSSAAQEVSTTQCCLLW
jgi:hypothetical protein